MASTELVKPEQYMVLSDPAGALEIVRDTLAGQEVSEFDLTRVKVPSGGGTTWEIPSKVGEGAEPTQTIEGVMLFMKSSRAWWKNKYSGGSEAPNCSSNDGVLATANPDEQGETEAIPADADPATGALVCETCAYNQWGTAMNDKGERTRGKACRESRQIFLLPPGRLLPIVIALPPTSLQGLKQYLLGLGETGRNWHHVVTGVKLEKVSGKGPDYSVAKFVVGESLTADDVAAVDAYRGAAEPALNKYAVAHALDQDDPAEPAAASQAAPAGSAEPDAPPEA